MITEHHHAHSHDRTDVGSRRLAVAVAINMLLTVAQIVGGVLSGSLSLIADALHNFSDAAGLLLALVARRISKRPADEQRTFSYGRAEVVGGLINLTSIMVIAGYLLIEAITRAVEHPKIDGWTVVIVAGMALLIDIGTALLTYSISKDSINIKAAFLHNLVDALASVAVIVSGSLIVLFDWYWTDIAATIGISISIVWMSWSPIKRCIWILMQSTPEHLSIEAVARTITAVSGVEGVEHLHIWPIDESTVSLEARVAMRADANLSDAEYLRHTVLKVLLDEHDIRHVMIEIVPSDQLLGSGLIGDL